MEAPKPGDRVRVRSPEKGRYHGRTGTVIRVLNGTGTPLDRIPEGCLEHYPYWFAVAMDGDAKPDPDARFIASELETS